MGMLSKDVVVSNVLLVLVLLVIYAISSMLLVLMPASHYVSNSPTTFRQQSHPSTPLSVSNSLPPSISIFPHYQHRHVFSRPARWTWDSYPALAVLPSDQRCPLRYRLNPCFWDTAEACLFDLNKISRYSTSESGMRFDNDNLSAVLDKRADRQLERSLR